MQTRFCCVNISALLSVFQIAYAAVDCTKGQNHELCKQEGVEGYPTFNYYNYGKFLEKYNGERGVSSKQVTLFFFLIFFLFGKTSNL